MELSLTPPNPNRISVSPPGRGWRARPEIVVNADYVRGLLEQNRLTERDEQVLHYLNELPLLSSRQIKRLFWPGTTTSNMHRRLRALYDYHLLDRVRMLDKAEGITYALGKAGQIWLNSSVRGGSAPRVNIRQLRHDLVIAEVVTLMVEGLRLAAESVQSVNFGLEFVGEARARVIHQTKTVVEPDARLRISAGKDRQTFLLEVDNNTERAAAFNLKLRRYHQASIAPGLIDSDRQAIVMLVAPSAERMAGLTNLIATAQAQHHHKLAWLLADLPALRQSTVFGTGIWRLVRAGKFGAINLDSVISAGTK